MMIEWDDTVYSDGQSGCSEVNDDRLTEENPIVGGELSDEAKAFSGECENVTVYELVPVATITQTAPETIYNVTDLRGK